MIKIQHLEGDDERNLLSVDDLELLGDVLPELHGHQHPVLGLDRRRGVQQLVHPLPAVLVPLLQVRHHAEVVLDLAVELVDELEPLVNVVVGLAPAEQLLHLAVQLGLHVVGEQDLQDGGDKCGDDHDDGVDEKDLHNLVGVLDILEGCLDLLPDVGGSLEPVLVVLHPGREVV